MVPDDTDYVFYLDIDEFLSMQSIRLITSFLFFNPYDVCKFQMNHFWKGGDFIGVGGDGWGYDAWCPRIFRYVPGMMYSNHRPPQLMLPDGKPYGETPQHFAHVINHYSYVYRESIIRKLKYYNLLYPQFDYMRWFHLVWEVWTPENREQIEAVHSIHPSVRNAKTIQFIGEHFIQWEQ